MDKPDIGIGIADVGIDIADIDRKTDNISTGISIGLEMINVNFDNVKDEINKFVGQDLGNHGNGNNSSSTKYFKFINFFVNQKSGHFKQFIITIEIIQFNVNDTKADYTVSTLFE